MSLSGRIRTIKLASDSQVAWPQESRQIIGYVMVGPDDLAKAFQSYDAILELLALVRAEDNPDFVAFAPRAAPAAAAAGASAGRRRRRPRLQAKGAAFVTLCRCY